MTVVQCDGLASTEMEVNMDLLEIAKKRAAPGVLVVDYSKKPVYLGPGVTQYLDILADSNPQLSDKPAKITIPKEISSLLDRLEESSLQEAPAQTANLAYQTVFIPGKKNIYCCRGFFLRGQKGAPRTTFHMMVLIEKLSERYDFNLDNLRQQFDLTERQMEIVRLLMKGAGNKEIAQKLYICEDTVKSHMKHIMKRLKVNSRMGILSLIYKNL
jgi:DNA-binding CsgD family transcriptional regulator